MRGTVTVGTALAIWACCSACGRGLPSTDWTCDYDATEGRPLTDPDATTGPDGSLPSVICQTTCGTPVTSCARTVLDGGVAGAICPVCTF
jgi:hypothetical protein